MNLENKLLVSITAGFLNMLLSIIIPCLIKKVKQPFMVKVRTVFNNNKKLILTSSLLISILVFLALTITDELNDVFINNNTSYTSSNTSELYYSDDTRAVLQSTDYDMFVPPGRDNIPGQNLVNYLDSNNNTLPKLDTSNLSEVVPNNVSLPTNNVSNLSNNVSNVNNNTLPSTLSTSNLSEVVPSSPKDLVSSLNNILGDRSGNEMNGIANTGSMTNSVLPPSNPRM
jgi:hypothetical protein